MDWKGVLGELAPTIGAAFGPLGVAGGLAVKQMLGIPAATDSELVNYIQSPDGLLKLKQAEYDYKIAVLGQETERYRIDKDDRASARVREQEVKDKVPARLASVTIIGFFIIVGYVLSGTINLSGEQGILVGTLVGYVSAKADQVLSYYFGSSSSSKAKDTVIQNMATR